MDEIVFSLLIAFNGMLTSYCDNLSTHHYHVRYHPCFNTQFRHSQTTQYWILKIFALLLYLSGKSKSDRAAFCTEEIGKNITRKLFWQRLGWQEKGILVKVVRHSTTTKSRSGSCGCIRQYWSYGPECNLYCFLSSLLPSFLPSCSHLRKHDFLRFFTGVRGTCTCFLPYLMHPASRLILRRICPDYLQVCPLFRLFRHC